MLKMNLCFSKRSPRMNKTGKHQAIKRETWAPEASKEHERARYHGGRTYIREGDEYRPRISEETKTEMTNEGYRRNRNNLHDKQEIAGNRISSVDEEDKNELSFTKATVHKDNVSKTAEGFRSSMLWKDLDLNKLPKRNEVLPTFPPNRYSIGPDLAQQICPTPVAPKKMPQFRVNLDVSHYAPNEVIVRIEERFLVAEGKHYSESDFGYETCEFYRKYPLPNGLDSSDVSYRINNDGVLIVTGQSPSELHTVKENTPLYSSNNDGKSKKYDNRYSSYDNVREEDTQYAKVNKSKQVVAFGDFKLVDDTNYVLIVNVNGYSPDDMKVKVIGNELLVQGIRKIECKEGNEQSITHKEFTKKYTIPSDADIDSISSRMTSNGHLKIECNKGQSGF